MKMPKKEIKVWIEALRSGEYKQGRGKLEDRIGHCCLGVACKLFAPNYTTGSDGFLAGLIPDSIAGAPEWLTHINSDFYEKVGVNLSQLNDGGTVLIFGTDNLYRVGEYVDRCTFEEIADALQAVYIEGAFDKETEKNE